MSVNKVILIGNICATPELKYSASGAAICHVRLATNEKWTGKDGAKHDEPEFHRITVFGKTAENVSQYLDRGSQCYIEGRIQTRSWEKDGTKHYSTEIVANTVQFLDRKGDAKPAETNGAAAEGHTDMHHDPLAEQPPF